MDQTIISVNGPSPIALHQKYAMHRTVWIKYQILNLNFNILCYNVYVLPTDWQVHIWPNFMIVAWLCEYWSYLIACVLNKFDHICLLISVRCMYHSLISARGPDIRVSCWLEVCNQNAHILIILLYDSFFSSTGETSRAIVITPCLSVRPSRTLLKK